MDGKLIMSNFGLRKSASLSITIVVGAKLAAHVSLILLTTTSQVDARLARTCGGAVRVIHRESGRYLKEVEFPDLLVGPTGTRRSATLSLEGKKLSVSYRRCRKAADNSRNKWTLPAYNEKVKTATVVLSVESLEPVDGLHEKGNAVSALKPMPALRMGSEGVDVEAAGFRFERDEEDQRLTLKAWSAPSGSIREWPRENRISWQYDYEPLFIGEGALLIFNDSTSLCRFSLKTGHREWCHTIDPLGARRAGPSLQVDVYRLPEGFLVVTDGAGMYLLSSDNGLAHWHHPYANMDAVPVVLVMEDSLILGPMQQW
jgi:hypothetical protein